MNIDYSVLSYCYSVVQFWPKGFYLEIYCGYHQSGCRKLHVSIDAVHSTETHSPLCTDVSGDECFLALN